MAEGGDFGNEDPVFDHRLDQDDDETEVNNKTQPYAPGAASTPYQPGQWQSGEETEMQTRRHEKTGLPDTSYEETPLLGDCLVPEEKLSRLQKARDFIKKRFYRVDFGKLVPISFSKKGNNTEIVVLGPKKGETKIFKRDESGFLKRFTDKLSTALGERSEEIIAEDRATIREAHQSLIESQKQLKADEDLAAEKREKEQERQELRQKTRKSSSTV